MNTAHPKLRLRSPDYSSYGCLHSQQLNSTQSKQLILSCKTRSLQAITNGESTPCRPSPSRAPGAPTCRFVTELFVQEPSPRLRTAGSAGMQQGNRDLPSPEPPDTFYVRWERAQHQQQPGGCRTLRTGLGITPYRSSGAQAVQQPKSKIAARLAAVHWKQEWSWSPGKGRFLRTAGEVLLLH